MKARKEKNRFLLRLDPEVYRGLTRLSKTQNVSMNALCSRFIEDGLRAGDLNQKWMKEIVSAYQDDELLALILFGSQARGEATATSDLDLLLVFSAATKITRSLYRKFESVLESHPDQSRTSIHCARIPEDVKSVSGFWFEIALDGKVLWKKNDEIDIYLSKVKSAICSGKYVRKMSSGQPYWMQNEK
jgi:predicted nucleotidyltransferase